MNLKNIFLKSVATTMTISIVFGNISVSGLGISKAIAENSNTPDISIEIQNEKYVQYSEETQTGVAFHSKLSIYPNQTKDNYLPTKSVELGVNLPSLNGYLPEKGIVAEGRTKSTTGEEINTKINQNYDSNSGLLTISYENMPNDEGEIYSDFKENVKDEFEIIYIYPAQAYTGNEEEVKLNYAINVKMMFKTQDGSITSQTSKNIELTEKENKSDILTFGITGIEEKIYKGFLYSNIENKTNYDTEHKTVSTLCVLNNQAINELTMELKASEFVLNDEDETMVSSNGKIVYKATGISKYEFDKILGQEGYIEFYLGEEVIAKVSYVEVDNKETKKLAVIYLDGTTSILSDEDTSIIVEYPENLDNLKIKVSKPVAEGFVHFENQNIIIPSEDYGCKIEDIKYIRTQGIVNAYTYNTDIPILEPETKISVTSSNTNFSTLQTSKTTITVKLDDTNASTKLFNNPIITVKLPEGLIGGNLSSPEIVNGNGLKIKKATAKGNVITIELEGKQTAYDLNNVSGGVSIVMDFENIDFDDTLPTHSDKIQVTCKQENKTVETSQNVNIVSKAGLLMLSKLSNYDDSNNILTTIDNSIQTVEIDSESDVREVVQTLNLVNNYDEDLTNVQIIGRIGYSGNKATSTFETKLTKAIEVSDSDVKVYYSNNKEANIKDDSWIEEFSSEAKAYKVVINNSKIGKLGNLGIKEYVQIPKNVGVNQETYLNWSVTYTYKERNVQEELIVGMQTEKDELSNNGNQIEQNIMTLSGETIPVSLSITPSVTQNYVHSGQIVTYKLRVTNNGTEDLSDLVLTDIIPDNAIYSYYELRYDAMMTEYFELLQDLNIKQKEWKINVLKSGDSAEVEIMLKMSEVSTEQIMQNVVKLQIGEQTISTVNELILKPAEIYTNLTTNSEGVLGLTYDAGDELQYYISVKNITDKNLKNVKVQYELPEYFEYVTGGLASYDEFDGYNIEKTGNYNDNDGIFEYNIENLASGAENVISVCVKVKQLNNKNTEEINSIAKVYVNNELYETNVKTIETKQAAFEIYLSANTNDKEILNKNDEVVYTIEVKNVGENEKSVNIIDNVPEQLDVLKLEYSINGINKFSSETTKQDLKIVDTLKKDDILKIKITAKVKIIEVEKETIINVINKATLKSGELVIESNEVSINIKPEVKENMTNPEQPDAPEQPEQPDNPNLPDNPTEPNNPSDNNQESKVYSISGIAWIDENKNGKKDENEKLQDSVIVSLVNKETGNFAIDKSGNRITTITDETGNYEFSNIPEGTYIVLFEFDTNTYTVTTYQKTDVEENLNSDAILSTVTIDGNKKLVAITDNILLSENKENIDIGLITNAIFDLSLNKQITKITVSNSQGTEVTEYKDGDTAKIDLVAKYMNTAKVIVNYKFTVINNGDITGYVNSLVDDMPSGLEFSSELNTNWYKGSDGKLYTTLLSGIAIKPGESLEIELVLTKNMTEENTGVFPNNAELEKISNLENIVEKEEKLENNQSSATLIISIKTGSAVLYIGITLLSIGILVAGTYLIKKKVLSKGI